MTVLKIIGVILLLMGIYALIEKVKEKTWDKYQYESFDSSTAIVVAIAYYLLYFGWGLYKSALSLPHGDILNGIILIIIGGVIASIMFLAALKQMQFSFMGFVYAVFEFAIYVPVALVGLIAVFVIGALLSQTRPTWVINND